MGNIMGVNKPFGCIMSPCVWRQVHFAVCWVLVFDSRKTDNENKDDDVSDDEFDHKAALMGCWICVGGRWWSSILRRGTRPATSTDKP